MKRDLLSNAASRPTIDWRGADWYATSRATNEEERASHEAAVGILQEYEATGRPFALFLRLFKLNLLYESHDGSPVKALVVDLRDELQTRGASFIQVQNTDDVGRIVDKVSHDLPSLFLEDARWLDVVKALIGRAEMIVCECPSLAAGLSAELQACVELARVDRTVVVVASSAELEYVGNKNVVQPFYRMMLTQELDGPQLARNVVFRDLIDRIAKISALAQGKRATAIRQGSLDRAVPITFRGLASGLMRIAERYASIRNSGGTFSAGVRAVKAAEAASGPVHAIRYLIRTADLCEQSGHALLALTVLDDAENKRKSLGAGVEEALQRRLDATIQRRYHLLLGRLFEAMMKERQAEELWRLAQSRAAHALEHGERSIMAQCFAWMAAAAVLEEKYDLAKDHAQDAIALARSCRQRFYEGFASFYLGHAERASGHPEDAARAYSRALSLLGGRRFGPIHAATMLSMAEVTEQLGNREAALKLYASARELAQAMHQRDIEEAASLGERRARQST